MDASTVPRPVQSMSVKVSFAPLTLPRPATQPDEPFVPATKRIAHTSETSKPSYFDESPRPS